MCIKLIKKENNSASTPRLQLSLFRCCFLFFFVHALLHYHTAKKNPYPPHLKVSTSSTIIFTLHLNTLQHNSSNLLDLLRCSWKFEGNSLTDWIWSGAIPTSGGGAPWSRPPRQAKFPGSLAGRGPKIPCATTVATPTAKAAIAPAPTATVRPPRTTARSACPIPIPVWTEDRPYSPIRRGSCTESRTAWRCLRRKGRSSPLPGTPVR